MADLLSVAFVGGGETTKENVAALLADFLSEDKDYNPPIFPSVRPKEAVGLVRAYDWTAAEFGTANLDEVDLPLIVGKLLAQRDDKDAPAIPFLIYVPGEGNDTESAHYHQVSKARDAGIRVLDLTQGLDDFTFPGPVDSGETGPNGEPIPEPETPRRERKMRGQPREDGEVDEAKAAEIAANMQREDPPWDEDEPGITVPDGVAQESVIIPAPSGISITLSERTVALLLETFSSLATDVAGQVLKDQAIQDLLERSRPKQPTSPHWAHEDGTYRKREGKGRGRKGETAVDLTTAEVNDLREQGLLTE